MNRDAFIILVPLLFPNIHKTCIDINFQVIPKKVLFFNLISNCFEECFNAYKTGRASDIIIKKYQTLLQQNISKNLSMETYNTLSSKKYSLLHEKVEDLKRTYALPPKK